MFLSPPPPPKERFDSISSIEMAVSYFWVLISRRDGKDIISIITDVILVVVFLSTLLSCCLCATNTSTGSTITPENTRRLTTAYCVYQQQQPSLSPEHIYQRGCNPTTKGERAREAPSPLLKKKKKCSRLITEEGESTLNASSSIRCFSPPPPPTH